MIDNDDILEQFGRAYDEWQSVIRDRLNIDRMRVNISTIMPKQLLSLVPTGGLQSMFGIIIIHCL